MNSRRMWSVAGMILGLVGVAIAPAAPAALGSGGDGGGGAPVREFVKSEAEWRKCLTPAQFRVLRRKGTERAFTGKYWNHHARGVYRCAACGLELFGSETKFDSGTGWPSFQATMAKDHVATGLDLSLGVERDEVLCARCGGHLGHVFGDGPPPTHLRYCINSEALDFVPAK